MNQIKDNLINLKKHLNWWKINLLIVYFLVVVFFSIFTITDGKLMLNGGFRGESFLAFGQSHLAIGYAGASLSLIGTVFAVAAAIYRFFRFKTEILMAIISNLMIGLGLILTGIPTDGILILVLQGSISLAAWPIWHISILDDGKYKTKVNVNFDKKHIFITIIIFCVMYAMIGIIYGLVGNGGWGYSGVLLGQITYDDLFKNWRFHFDILNAAMITTGIIMYTIFRWRYGFLILFLSNIASCILYALPNAFGQEFWNMTLFILMFFYLILTIINFINWKKK